MIEVWAAVVKLSYFIVGFMFGVWWLRFYERLKRKPEQVQSDEASA
jgi:hypothetical protein